MYKDFSRFPPAELSLDAQLGPDSSQTKGLRDEEEEEAYATMVVNDKTQAGEFIEKFMEKFKPA